MIPSSSTSCSGSSGSVYSGVTGTFGATNQNVAALTITNGIVTGALNRTLSPVTGSAGCSGNFVPCITVTNGIVTSLGNREITGGGSSGRTHNVSLLGMEPVTTVFNTGNIADSEFTFITDFKPTNARISVYQFNTGYVGLEIDLAYSTDNVNFTPAGINLPIVGVGDYFITDTGSFSIPGTPSVVYWKPIFKNSTGSAKSVTFASLNITVWS
jgi:hypothetical protein